MIKKIRESLTLKWMVFSILLATIPLAIGAFSIIRIYQKDLKRSIIEIEKDKASMVVERTQAFFEKVVSNLVFLARDENFRKGSLSHTKGHLESLLYQHDYLVELTLLNEKGQETLKVSKYGVVKPSDLKSQSKSEMFGKASKGKTYYGEFYLTPDIVPTMVITVPIEEYIGEPVGVLSAKIHLRYLWNLIPQTQIGKRGSTYVVDQEGNLIAHPDTRRVLLGLNVRHLPMVHQVVAGKEGSLEFEYPRGENYLSVYKPIKELGWGVIVQVPVEEAYAPLRQVANTALKWILIALSIAIIFSLFLTRKLILPIKQLSNQMGKVSQGNLDVQIAPTTKDELGFLTESFNQMVQDLKQSHGALKKAEEKYRKIFEDSKDMVYITSVDGKVIDVNQAGVDLFGYGSKEEMMQVYVRDTFLNAEDRRRFRDEIRKEWFIKDFEVKLKRRDGTPIDVLITANVRRDDSGNIISYEGIIKNISVRKRMEEELLRRTGELQTLHDLSVLINQTLDLEKVLPIALEKALSLTGFEMGAIHLLNEDEEILELKFNSGQPPILNENAKVFKVGEGVAGKVVQLKRPIILSVDEYPTPRIIPFLKEEGVQTLMSIPLLAKEKAIGAITLLSRSSRALTQREINLLESIGNEIGLALENAQLFEETKKRLDELTILYEIMKISASSLNLDKMLKEIINSLNNFFKLEALGILLVDETTKRLLPHPASYKELTLKNIGKLGLCVGKGITGWVAEMGGPLLVNDVRKDSRYISGDEEILSEMCVPLKIGQKVIGVIDAQSRELNAFSEDDLRLLNIVGGQLAILIENIHLQEEIKQSEEKYRTVVEGVLDGVCVIGGDYRFKYVNEKLTEIQGYSREELIGNDFRDYLDEESKSLLADRESQRKRGIRLPPHFELTILRKDGDVRNVEISARSIKDSKGNVNIIVILKDITEKKRMEEQLLQTEKLRALGEMASGVAHDFNNALAAILGNTQLLLYTVKDEELKETLQIIEKVSRDAAQTVRRLQEFTRKRIHQELFKLDVNSIIKDVIEITKPKWKDEVQGRGVPIEMISNFEEIPPVEGNASELREVIANMIFNAIEAMPKGGKLEIRTFQRKTKVYIQISDTGIGMTEEVRKKIFEPFFTTKPFSNTGLGLSMSYGIIKRFEGEIHVESNIGSGTTFTIILPIGSEVKEEAIAPFPSLMIKKGREARILMIDDEESVRSVLARILSQGNHQVTVAENGKEGIQLFKEKEFDIVLTDLGMPGMSGWEVCKAIKKMSPRTPVGMITGWGMKLSQKEREENNLDFLISKPFDFTQILKVVDETMESKEKGLLS